ncbi:MAG: PIG-L family deacetylase [Chloroflexi bacterium]|nr:PIG-L family deacetylase [Chloroflexota bacterium]
MVFEKIEHTGPGDRIMVIVAHPDDAEFMCAGSAARGAREGKEIIYLLGTSGDKGTSDRTIRPADLAVIREAEQQDACKTIGGSHVEFLRHEDGVLVSDIQLRKEIVRVIRQFKPSAVITQDPTSRWMSGRYVNHPDHRAMGDAAMDAVFPSARDYHVFPELVMNEGLEPHIVEHLYLGAHGGPFDVAIDITSTIDVKVVALKCHKSQMPDSPTADVDDYIRSMAKGTAGDTEYEYAETFRYFNLAPLA